MGDWLLESLGFDQGSHSGTGHGGFGVITRTGPNNPDFINGGSRCKQAGSCRAEHGHNCYRRSDRFESVEVAARETARLGQQRIGVQPVGPEIGHSNLQLIRAGAGGTGNLDPIGRQPRQPQRLPLSVTSAISARSPS